MTRALWASVDPDQPWFDDNPPVPQQLIVMQENISQQQYNAIKARWHELYRFGAPDPLVNKCAEIFCIEITDNHSGYYPFCSWDCQDWDEQIKRSCNANEA